MQFAIGINDFPEHLDQLDPLFVVQLLDERTGESVQFNGIVDDPTWPSIRPASIIKAAAARCNWSTPDGRAASALRSSHSSNTALIRASIGRA
jgi:hypothetical protein